MDMIGSNGGQRSVYQLTAHLISNVDLQASTCKQPSAGAKGTTPRLLAEALVREAEGMRP